jgi:hypothetical protein
MTRGNPSPPDHPTMGPLYPHGPLSRARERGSLTGSPNHIESPGEISGDCISGDAQDSVAKLFQIVVALSVILTLLIMDRAVDLDDQSSLGAEEVGDVRPD